MKSNGPPRPSNTKTNSAYSEFAKDVLDADGEWQQMEQIETGNTNTYQSIYRHVGATFTEVTIQNGTIYARMRK